MLITLHFYEQRLWSVRCIEKPSGKKSTLQNSCIVSIMFVPTVVQPEEIPCLLLDNAYLITACQTQRVCKLIMLTVCFLMILKYKSSGQEKVFCLCIIWLHRRDDRLNIFAVWFLSNPSIQFPPPQLTQRLIRLWQCNISAAPLKCRPQ